MEVCVWLRCHTASAPHKEDLVYFSLFMHATSRRNRSYSMDIYVMMDNRVRVESLSVHSS
jgi:hypothetical protein